MGVAGIFFAELPLLIARFQILLAGGGRITQGSFYMWLAKDILFACLIVIVVAAQKIKTKYQKYLRSSCAPAFDNPNVFFEPEKRDRYIKRQRNRKDEIKHTTYPSVNSITKKVAPPTTPPQSLAVLPETVAFGSAELKRKPSPQIPHRPIHSSTPPEKKRKTSPSEGKKKVTFKIDKGRGRFSVLAAREDDHPV